VHEPERAAQVVRRVRSLARSHGVDPDIVETTYRTLVEAMTELEDPRRQEARVALISRPHPGRRPPPAPLRPLPAPVGCPACECA
jgi:hypothetical protein